MQPARDYYEVLGVGKDADARSIKRAFLKLARELHPDVNQAPDAEERFKEVNEAYSVLSDERKRANYDRFGDAEGPAGFGSDYVDMSDIFGGGFGFGDIFDSFFGGASGRGGQAQQRTRGRDMAIRLQITLEDAACGCTKTIAYDRLAPCDDCEGKGSADGGAAVTCTHCNGTGRVVETQRTIFGQMQTQTACPECAGTGSVVENPCETCQGQGRTPARETVEVEIPAGVRTGQTITIPGRGEAGLRGDASGDLVVSIEVAPHPRFEQHGDDLYTPVEVDALSAIVGCTIDVEGILPDEIVQVEIPAGCPYGHQVVTPDAGMPRQGKALRGNLISVVAVTTPDDLTDEQLEQVQGIVDARAEKREDARADAAEGEPADKSEDA